MEYLKYEYVVGMAFFAVRDESKNYIFDWFDEYESTLYTIAYNVNTSEY